MKKTLLLVILLVSAGVAIVLPQESASPGEKLYRTHCAMCHGADGKGDTRAGKMTDTPDLTLLPWKNGTAPEEVEKATRDGVGKMPAYKRKLTPEEIVQVVEYTRRLTGVDRPEATPEERP